MSSVGTKRKCSPPVNPALPKKKKRPALEICCICQEPIRGVRFCQLQSCGHKFHSDCIQYMVLTSAQPQCRCPVCRSPDLICQHPNSDTHQTKALLRKAASYNLAESVKLAASNTELIDRVNLLSTLRSRQDTFFIVGVASIDPSGIVDTRDGHGV